MVIYILCLDLQTKTIDTFAKNKRKKERKIIIKNHVTFCSLYMVKYITINQLTDFYNITNHFPCHCLLKKITAAYEAMGQADER